jgi:hypothetical protein
MDYQPANKKRDIYHVRIHEELLEILSNCRGLRKIGGSQIQQNNTPPFHILSFGNLGNHLMTYTSSLNFSPADTLWLSGIDFAFYPLEYSMRTKGYFLKLAFLFGFIGMNLVQGHPAQAQILVPNVGTSTPGITPLRLNELALLPASQLTMPNTFADDFPAGTFTDEGTNEISCPTVSQIPHLKSRAPNTAAEFAAKCVPQSNPAKPQVDLERNPAPTIRTFTFENKAEPGQAAEDLQPVQKTTAEKAAP